MTRVFRGEPLLEIIGYLEHAFADGEASDAACAIRVLDPDRGRGRYAGEHIVIDGVAYTHRSFRTWVDLAERLGLRLATPHAAEPPLVELRFERLAPLPRRRATVQSDPTERYGVDSEFARITKLEDPGFVIDLRDAIGRAALGPEARVLDLGVNTGDELALLCALGVRQGAITAIDHSSSALAVARARFPSARLVEADVNGLAETPPPASVGELGRFDLVLSIGTLHSPSIDDRAVLRAIVQNHLTARGAVIVGFPNTRYRDGEVEYGTRMKNFRQPELGLLVKDVAFYRKYLQQHDRQVFVTGKHYLLVTAIV